MAKKRKYTAKQKAQVLYLYAQNPELSVRQIEMMTGVPRSSVHRIISEQAKKEKTLTKIERAYYKMSEEFKERIINALLNVVKSKGRTRAAANKSFLYDLFQIDFNNIGINNKKETGELISYLVKQKFGSWEKLEAKRRPFKEHSKYRSSKGRIKRTPALLEIDGTGLTFEIDEDKKTQVSVFLAIDTYTGYIFPIPMIITNKSKAVNYYNRAFNSKEIAKFLIQLFEEYGIPEKIRTDNDPTIKNEYIQNALKPLGITHIKTKRPNHKLIERIIDDFKKRMRYYQSVNQVKTLQDIENRVLEAIKATNLMERKFSTFNQKHIPEELFAAVSESYKPEDPEKIRRAFMEVKELTVRNNKIQWEGYVYEFLMPEKVREGEYGRKPKAPKVIVKRHIDNASFIEVYSLKGEYLGEARLISSDVPTLDTAQRKQLKDAEKRAAKKSKKLNKEIEEINQEVSKMKEEIKEENTVPTSFETFEVEEEETLPSVWNILTGGENDA